MAKKLIITNFKGERPRLPDNALPQESASIAINTRLSNGEIRAYPQIVDSTDANSILSSLITGGYTNFYKASTEDAINWISWDADDKVSTLEIRYNDISAYEFPLPPQTTVQPGEELAVGFTGQYVSNLGEGANENWTSARTTGAFASNITAGVEYSFTQSVTGTVVNEFDTLTTFLWQYVSGDTSITVTDPNLQTAEFNANLIYPSLTGINNGTSKSAQWRCTITDASGNVGTKEITVFFTVYLFAEGGGGGTPFDDGNDYWEEQ